jgi:hypothetical protein
MLPQMENSLMRYSANDPKFPVNDSRGSERPCVHEVAMNSPERRHRAL